MSWMTDNELTQIRADVAAMLPETVVIVGVASGTGYAGAHTMTESARGTVAGRLDRLTRQDNSGVIADAEAGRTFYTLSVEWNADLRDGDRVRVGGETYHVVQVQRAQSDRFVRRAVVAASDEGN